MAEETQCNPLIDNQLAFDLPHKVIVLYFLTLIIISWLGKAQQLMNLAVPGNSYS